MKIALDDIIINQRMRNIHKERVDKLVESIGEIGLLNPITLTPTNELVAGVHRIEACKQLGWTEIEYTIFDKDKLLTELAEIDENLVRNDLSVVERSRHQKRRKEIYEELYPKTKVGISQSLGMNKTLGHNVSESDSLTSELQSGINVLLVPKTETYTKEAARQLGMNKRTVEQDIQIGEDVIPEILDAVDGTDVTKTQLLHISRLNKDDQAHVLNEVKAISRSKFGSDDLVLLSKRSEPEQRLAVEDVCSGASETLSEALDKLELNIRKPKVESILPCPYCTNKLLIKWENKSMEKYDIM